MARAKKQLQAEFGISQGGFIEVEGYTYTRQAVFEEIDHPLFLKRLEFHQQIWASPVLLALLEKNSFDPATIRDGFTNFWKNREFDAFFSPYFVGPFNYICRSSLATADFSTLAELLYFEDFLQADEREEAFRPLRIFMDENFRLLRNTNAKNYKMMRDNISLWIDKQWHLLFNALPNEFYDIKQDIILRLINLGVDIQKTHRRDCRRMSEKLIALQDVPENVRELIVSNHAAYNSSKSVSFRGGFWILWFIVGIMRAVSAGSCNDSSNKSQYLQYPVGKFKIDSLIKTLPDSSKRALGDSIIFQDDQR